MNSGGSVPFRPSNEIANENSVGWIDSSILRKAWQIAREPSTLKQFLRLAATKGLWPKAAHSRRRAKELGCFSSRENQTFRLNIDSRGGIYVVTPNCGCCFTREGYSKRTGGRAGRRCGFICIVGAARSCDVY